MKTKDRSTQELQASYCPALVIVLELCSAGSISRNVRPTRLGSYNNYYVNRARVSTILAAVAEIGFSHRLTAYKIVGQSYLRKYFFRISNIQATRSHAQLIFFSTVIKKL